MVFPMRGVEAEMIALEETGVISNLERPELEEWLNSGELHRPQAAEGSTLICLNSLLARVQKTTTIRAGIFRGSETYKGDDMNSKWKLASFSLGLAACLATAAAAQAPGPEKPQYTVTDLGVLGKGNNATSNDMNSIGWVAGSIEPGSQWPATLLSLVWCRAAGGHWHTWRAQQWGGRP